jgi:hypothetical protein
VWLGGAHAGWMMEGALQKLVLVVTSVDTKETLERWTFDIQGEEQPAEGRCVPVQRRASSRIVNILGFGTGRQKMALDRWTKTTLLGRTCSPRHGLQSCRGKSAPRPPTETRMCDSPLFPPLNPKDGGRGWLQCAAAPQVREGDHGRDPSHHPADHGVGDVFTHAGGQVHVRLAGVHQGGLRRASAVVRVVPPHPRRAGSHDE